MPWSPAQRQRLAFEKTVLDKYFGDRVSWTDPTGKARVEVKVVCSDDKEYILRVYLPPDYPASCPSMIVLPPSVPWFSFYLLTRDGKKMNHACSLDCTLEGAEGFTCISHCKGSLWKNNDTLYQVFMKGFIWLEAYEAHLRTGKSISSYLQETD